MAVPAPPLKIPPPAPPAVLSAMVQLLTVSVARVVDAAAGPAARGGVAGDGAVAEGQRRGVDDASPIGTRIVGDGAIADGQRPGRVDDAAAGVAGDGAVADGQGPAVVQMPPPLASTPLAMVSPARVTTAPLPTVKTRKLSPLAGCTVRLNAPGPSRSMLLSRSGRALSRLMTPATPGRKVIVSSPGIAVGVQDGLAQRAGAAVVGVLDGQNMRLEGPDVDGPVDDAGVAGTALVVRPRWRRCSRRRWPGCRAAGPWSASGRRYLAAGRAGGRWVGGRADEVGGDEAAAAVAVADQVVPTLVKYPSGPGRGGLFPAMSVLPIDRPYGHATPPPSADAVLPLMVQLVTQTVRRLVSQMAPPLGAVLPLKVRVRTHVLRSHR